MNGDEATDLYRHIDAKVEDAVARAMERRDRELRLSRRDVVQLLGIAGMLILQAAAGSWYVRGLESKVDNNTTEIRTRTEDRYTASRAMADNALQDQRIERTSQDVAELRGLIREGAARDERMLQKLGELGSDIRAVRTIVEERAR